MSEQDLRDIITASLRRGHDEGIKTAAEAVRLSVNNPRLVDFLRRDPVGALQALANALDQGAR